MEDFQILRGNPLNYNLFLKRFNRVSKGCTAKITEYWAVLIIDNYDQQLLASLGADSYAWLFNGSFFGQYERAYSWKELMLMVKLAVTLPMFRNSPKEER